MNKMFVVPALLMALMYSPPSHAASEPARWQIAQDRAVGCKTPDLTHQLESFVDTGNREAFESAVSIWTSMSVCRTFKKGQEVYVQDPPIFPDALLCARLRGDINCLFMLQGSVEQIRGDPKADNKLFFSKYTPAQMEDFLRSLDNAEKWAEGPNEPVTDESPHLPGRWRVNQETAGCLVATLLNDPYNIQFPDEELIEKERLSACKRFAKGQEVFVEDIGRSPFFLAYVWPRPRVDSKGWYIPSGAIEPIK